MTLLETKAKLDDVIVAVNQLDERIVTLTSQIAALEKLLASFSGKPSESRIFK